MTINSKSSGDTCTFSFGGELDESVAEFARQKLDVTLEGVKPYSRVVIDLSGLSFMDSTGIGVLIGRYKKFAPNGLNFVIKNPTTTIDHILKMTGIYKIMPKIS